LGDIERIEKGQKQNSVVIEEIRNSIPYGLQVQTFSFMNGRVSLSLQTTDFKAFKDYESALKNSPNYEDVKVNVTKTESVYDIRISFLVTTLNG
jgi:Tfp pilus assembly protein PilN